MNPDWAEQAALEISRSLVLDILDEDIVQVAAIIRKFHLEYERRAEHPRAVNAEQRG